MPYGNIDVAAIVPAGAEPVNRYRRTARQYRDAVMAETPPLPAPTLRGSHVALEPLRAEHVDDLLHAALEDRATYGWTTVPDSPAAMAAYVDGLLADAAHGLIVPFAQRCVTTGRLVGATRYLDIHHWRRRPVPDAVEIGGTWLAASAQRTAINTEAKLLLLTNAFETWDVERVAICTDAGNARSRAAIERLGARFEGVLRSYRPAAGPAGAEHRPGGLRDTALYAIVAPDWPTVRADLTRRLGRAERAPDNSH